MMNTLKPLRWQSNKNSTFAFPLGARNATIALCVRSTTYNIIKYWWLRHTRGGAKRLHLLLLLFFLLVSNFHGHPLNARLHHPTLFIRYRKICTKLKKNCNSFCNAHLSLLCNFHYIRLFWLCHFPNCIRKLVDRNFAEFSCNWIPKIVMLATKLLIPLNNIEL